jgi:hypothetical protein
MAKTIQEKISELESKLYEQNCKDNERINRLGWGYGMRCVKMPKFTRADALKEKIENLKMKLHELQ